MFFQIITVIIGISTFIGSLFYNKNTHKRFSEGASSASNSDSLLALVVVIVLSFFLSVGPWWVTKIIFIAISLSVIYIGFFLM